MNKKLFSLSYHLGHLINGSSSLDTGLPQPPHPFEIVFGSSTHTPLRYRHYSPAVFSTLEGVPKLLICSTILLLYPPKKPSPPIYVTLNLLKCLKLISDWLFLAFATFSEIFYHLKSAVTLRA